MKSILDDFKKPVFTKAMREIIKDPDPGSTCQCWDAEKGCTCGKPATVCITNEGNFCSKCISNLCQVAEQECTQAKADYDLAASKSSMWLEALSYVNFKYFEESRNKNI